ncbi:MAG TPA: hypothetical protein VMV86_02920 [Methanosarcinales archaeon]|nr:hypothetical protein [Methanosarcinales archaeon]
MYAELASQILQRHLADFILMIIAITLIIFALRIAKSGRLSQIRLWAVDMDQQELKIDHRIITQKVAILEAQVSYLLRIQQEKERVKYKETEERMLRKLDSV